MPPCYPTGARRSDRPKRRTVALRASVSSDRRAQDQIKVDSLAVANSESVSPGRGANSLAPFPAPSDDAMHGAPKEFIGEVAAHTAATLIVGPRPLARALRHRLSGTTGR